MPPTRVVQARARRRVSCGGCLRVPTGQEIARMQRRHTPDPIPSPFPWLAPAHWPMRVRNQCASATYLCVAALVTTSLRWKQTHTHSSSVDQRVLMRTSRTVHHPSRCVRDQLHGAGKRYRRILFSFIFPAHVICCFGCVQSARAPDPLLLRHSWCADAPILWASIRQPNALRALLNFRSPPPLASHWNC
ncbi:hypothetical protein FA95DRAFT_1566785, partial [Auriscalpium vulgare]